MTPPRGSRPPGTPAGCTADGAVETPVQRRSRTAGWRKDIGPVLRTEDFDRMVARLDAELAAARRGQAGGGAVLR
ncbi:hypothetical protein AB0883_26640 [Micromonospora sp. NPDC047812]|uniref:hypothetical protein n=1 Tax=Micromonospora sp. NPDC047812 TaxID=3155742 RepID=UPI0034564A70